VALAFGATTSSATAASATPDSVATAAISTTTAASTTTVSSTTPLQACYPYITKLNLSQVLQKWLYLTVALMVESQPKGFRELLHLCDQTSLKSSLNFDKYCVEILSMYVLSRLALSYKITSSSTSQTLFSQINHVDFTTYSALALVPFTGLVAVGKAYDAIHGTELTCSSSPSLTSLGRGTGLPLV
jgi:hypothetical protein